MRPVPKAAGSKVVGYFTEWGIYDRKYYVKNIETSGSAAKLTHINYAFGNVTGGKCAMGDADAATGQRVHGGRVGGRGRRHLRTSPCAATSTSCAS